MNRNIHNSISFTKNSPEVSQRDGVTSTENRTIPDDEPFATDSTYASIYWLFNYIKMCTSRLASDLYTSSMGYWYPDGDLQPPHIVNLIQVQSRLRAERESHTVTYSSSRPGALSPALSMNNFFSTSKSYTLSCEEDAGIHYTPKDLEYLGNDRDPMFVIVDSSCVSNPSSRELLIDSRFHSRDTILKRNFNKSVTPLDVPSTSRDVRNDYLISPMKETDSSDEMQMVDINLQSDNDILVGDIDSDSDSIVISYLRNKDMFLDLEGTLMSTKKKSSLLESVPRMETILESEQFSAFPITSTTDTHLTNLYKNGNETN
nr:uncharacterized protein LOC110382234 isoform X1 [Helicoverpa armigera]